MIIGLLDVRWETRHGCSLGLMGLLHGLGLGTFPDSTELSDPERSSVLIESFDNEQLLGFDTAERERERERELVHTVNPPSSHSAASSSTSSSTSTSVSSILPQYLVEDIICTGVCLLMLDRFIDLRASSSSGVSPAREVIQYPIMKIYFKYINVKYVDVKCKLFLMYFVAMIVRIEGVEIQSKQLKHTKTLFH